MTFNIEILYGSTTGNTEDLAKTIELKLMASKTSIVCKSVLDLNNNYTLNADFNIWCCSTWGIEPACLQEDFEHFINHKLSLKSIKGAKFLIFALGDSYYPHFAAAGDILSKILLENGANILINALKIQDPWEQKTKQLDEVLLKFISNYIN